MRGNKVVRIPKEAKEFPNYGKGKCLYCGESLMGHQTKYCCERHGIEYRYDIRPYMLVNWAGLRDLIFERDLYRCADCGGKPEEAHHIEPLYRGGEEYDMDNCVSLCHECHIERHRQLRAEDREREFKKIQCTLSKFQ